MSVSDDMQDGHCCQYCGVWNDDLLKASEGARENQPIKWTPPGHPWTCPSCHSDNTHPDGPA
jgi:hypothetical protein